MLSKLLFSIICVLVTVVSHSQNVGIGTASPNASAALHISSTTRGFLPPRMTSAQRTAIVSPLNGLIVYDSEVERLYTYVDGTWRYMLTNETWATNGSDVYQTTMNVGIGNANPQEKLHVTGNIRATGELQSNGGIVLNQTNGTITLQTGALDKGFIQLSGDNLRIGTHSTNTLGKFIIRTGGADNLYVIDNGFVGINVADPLARLDVGGNIRLSGKMYHTTTGSAHMLPVAYGLIRSNAIVNPGSSGNFNVSLVQDGVFRITSDEFNTNTVVIATTTAVNLTIGAGQGPASNQLDIYIRNVDDGQLVNAWFNFVAFTR
jgi:hypothetical protein